MTAAPDRRAVAVAGHTADEFTARAGLASADPGVRATALNALERMGALGAADLVTARADASADVRRRAAALTAAHADVDLVPFLTDASPAVAEAAAWASGEREEPAPAVLDELCALASGAGTGDDPLVREAAVAALGAIGDDAGLDAILQATADKPAIRRRAVLALAPFVARDHPRAADVAAALRRAAEDRDWQVRQAAEDIAPDLSLDDDDEAADDDDDETLDEARSGARDQSV